MRSKDAEKMKRIVEYLDRCYYEENYVPTLQEIGDSMGMSKGNVFAYLKEMEQKGMIVDGGKRGLRTVRTAEEGTKRLPVVGEVACGVPLFAEENIEGYVTASASFLGKGEYFILRAHGDSMVDADIRSGDLVVVRKQTVAENGQIAVVLIDDCATLKRFYRENGRVRLHPENADMDDMFFGEVSVQGIAVKIIKEI